MREDFHSGQTDGAGEFGSYQVTREQEASDPLPDSILMSTVAAHQLPLRDLRLHQERVQLLEHLLVGLQRLRCWGLFRERREAQLPAGN